jgi:hypothetical protein
VANGRQLLIRRLQQHHPMAWAGRARSAGSVCLRMHQLAACSPGPGRLLESGSRVLTRGQSQSPSPSSFLAMTTRWTWLVPS